jgi:hypothetical protein
MPACPLSGSYDASLDFDAKDTVETMADGTVGALPVE